MFLKFCIFITKLKIILPLLLTVYYKIIFVTVGCYANCYAKSFLSCAISLKDQMLVKQKLCMHANMLMGVKESASALKNVFVETSNFLIYIT